VKGELAVADEQGVRLRRGVATVVKHRQSNAFLGTWMAKGLEGDFLILPVRTTTMSEGFLDIESPLLRGPGAGERLI
jgi:hypothetical protein